MVQKWRETAVKRLKTPVLLRFSMLFGLFSAP